MKRTEIRPLVVVAFLALFLALFTTGFLTAQEKPKADPVLSDFQKLQAENFQLRVALAQAQAQIADRDAKLASFELTARQMTLVEEFRKTLGGSPSARFDWATMKFIEEPKK
jgi:hypothetical protein